MKTLFRTLMITVLLAAGCGKLERQATVSSTDDFRELLVEQLRHSGHVKAGGGVVGQGGDIYTRTYNYVLPADSFPPGRIRAVAQAALEKWGEFDKYHTHGTDFDNNHFGIDYGSQSTHAFIDVIAYPQGDETVVKVLIRVVQ